MERKRRHEDLAASGSSAVNVQSPATVVVKSDPAAREASSSVLLAMDAMHVADEAAAADDDYTLLQRVQEFAKKLCDECDRAKERKEFQRREEERQERVRLSMLTDACRGCGKKKQPLTACLCFDPNETQGGLILCDDCLRSGQFGLKCQICAKLICLPSDNLGDPDMSGCCIRWDGRAMTCGDPDDGPWEKQRDCSNAVCKGCLDQAAFEPCFCGAFMYCASCTKTGNRAFEHCKICGTNYHGDEKGDCGIAECPECCKPLCPKCLGVEEDEARHLCLEPCEECKRCPPRQVCQFYRDNNWCRDDDSCRFSHNLSFYQDEYESSPASYKNIIDYWMEND